MIERQADALVEISPTMVAAGIAVLDQYEGAPIAQERLVARVFSAMVHAHGALRIQAVERESYLDIEDAH
jgi:hypothetical protein